MSHVINVIIIGDGFLNNFLATLNYFNPTSDSGSTN